VPPTYAIPSVAAVLGLAVIAVMWQASTIEPLYNSVLLPSPAIDEALPPIVPGAPPMTEVAVFAGGCFWGVQAVFQHVEGVTSAVSGYAGGSLPNPSYEQVASGLTGHAESVAVTFDPMVVSYGKLLQVFFSVAHDPTQVGRQGPDVGSQYRSLIFTTSVEQAGVASAYIEQLDAANVYADRIATEVLPLDAFWRAEEKHQDYVIKHPTDPYVATNDIRKLVNLRNTFPELWRNQAVRVASASPPGS
jgi:peptide-methionine (S)-S-oxide reductase